MSIMLGEELRTNFGLLTIKSETTLSLEGAFMNYDYPYMINITLLYENKFGQGSRQ